MIVSVDYRHGPEARFPAAADDAFAAVRWIAANAESIGGIPGQLAVAGWSAGANLAAGRLPTCDRCRGGPHDRRPTAGHTGDRRAIRVRPSYHENADGYVLTAPLMNWFWDHYADPDDRSDPRASPLRAASLADLPPAAIFTSEFDPLRDEGDAYAVALTAAGVEVQHVPCRGHIHTSLTAVDMIISSAPIRARMADAVTGFFVV